MKKGISYIALAVLCSMLIGCGKKDDAQLDFSNYTRYGFQRAAEMELYE